MEWTPTGIVSFKQYELKKESKQQLRTYLNKLDIDLVRIDSFIPALDKSVSEYYGMLEITSKCKPANIRNNLSAVLKKIEVLRDTLNELDHNSRILVNNLNAEGMTGVFDRLFELQVAINNAHLAAKGGSVVTYYKRTLVDSIADAIQKILSIKPTSTKKGLLVQCTAIVMADIKGKSADGVHTLVENVMKSRK